MGELMRRRLVDRQDGFRGGLNLVADESQLRPDEIRLARNVRLTDDGAAVRRGGSRRILTSPLPGAGDIQGGVAWSDATEAQRLLAVTGGTLYDGPYGVPATLTAEVGTLATLGPVSFAAFRNPTQTAVCYIADGGQLNKYDGTTLTTDLASTPSVSVLAVYNGRLYGISGQDEILYASALDNGDTLGVVASGGIQAAVRTFGRQKLCGLLTLGESLLLFHERGISRFTGVSIDDIAILAGTRGTSQDVGTVSPFSIIAVENVGYFASDRGFYRVTEGGVEPISAKIDPVIASLSVSDRRNIRAVHSRATREVWFYLPGAGIYAYNYRTGGWSGPWDGGFNTPATTCLFEAVDGEGKSVVIQGASDGYLRQCDFPDTYRDDVLADGTGGETYTFEMRLHRLFCGDSATEKSLRYVYVLADITGSTCTVQWRSPLGIGAEVVYARTATQWGGATWGSFEWGGLGTLSYRVQASGRGNFFDITIIDDGAYRVGFTSAEIETFEMGRR